MNESTNEPNKSDQWESTFQRWGKRPQPELPPFFYTRLQARLSQSVESAEWLPWWLRRPVYAYSALLLLILLNLGAVAGASWWTNRDQPAAISTTNSPLDDYEVDPVILAYE
ncbi:hypothetical protein [Fibrella aquatica]|jgi:hypothetical protein|uniref:hypothetical protein n=1 Tax=Fibrella aquatica TaxID=3242487 RepID=UPI003521C569